MILTPVIRALLVLIVRRKISRLLVLIVTPVIKAILVLIITITKLSNLIGYQLP